MDVSERRYRKGVLASKIESDSDELDILVESEVFSMNEAATCFELIDRLIFGEKENLLLRKDKESSSFVSSPSEQCSKKLNEASSISEVLTTCIMVANKGYKRKYILSFIIHFWSFHS